jgi:hypothetical protein
MGFTVGERSIRRWRRQLRFVPRRERLVEFSSAQQDADRHAYALDHQYDNQRNMIFEDEMTLCLRDTGVIYWLQRGADQPERHIGNLSAHVNLIGIIWWGGAVFEQYAGHLNANSYLAFLNRALQRHAPTMRRKTFLHDRASFHRTANVRTLLSSTRLRD